MEFEWDEAKSQRNRQSRGLPFVLARELFGTELVEEPDVRFAYGEARIKARGMLTGRVVVCVYTWRGDVRRIISLRYANRREANGYRAALGLG